MKRRLFTTVVLSLALTLALSGAASAQQLRYVSLGDSVASGLGLPPGDETSPVDEICGRSSAAYPAVLAREGAMQHTNLACSGATIWDGLLSDQERDGGDVAGQLRLLRDMHPDVVTVSIGANDRQWLWQLRNCYLRDCTGQGDWTYAFTRAKLYAALWRIQNEAGAWSVTVVQYYDPFGGSDAGCAAAPGLTDDEIRLLRAKLARLNAVIAETAAQLPGVNVARPDYSGHGLCSSDPWVQGLGDPAPLHPTDAGQVANARSVQAAW